MDYLRNYITKRRQSNAAKLEHIATEIFQIAEYEGQLWLTFNGYKVCPCSLLNEPPVEAVRKMRELYVKRNTK